MYLQIKRYKNSHVYLVFNIEKTLHTKGKDRMYGNFSMTPSTVNLVINRP